MARGIREEEPDVTITGAVVKRTSEKAILIITRDGEETWLPKSQLRGASNELKVSPDKVSVTMSAWIAGEKGFSSDEDDTGGEDG